MVFVSGRGLTARRRAVPLQLAIFPPPIGPVQYIVTSLREDSRQVRFR